MSATTQWLVEELPRLSEGPFPNLHLRDISVHDCQLQWTTPLGTSDAPETHMLVSTVKLMAVDLGSFAVEPYVFSPQFPPSGYSLTFVVAPGGGQEDYIPDGESSRDSTIREFGIRFTDTTSANRVGAALKRAAHLCGAKKAAF